MLQLNKKSTVQGRLDANKLLSQLGSQDNKDVLNLGMGAELSVQVLNEAKEKLSRELLSPNDTAALLPFKQLKLLYAVVCQVLKASKASTAFYQCSILPEVGELMVNNQQFDSHEGRPEVAREFHS